MFERLSPTGVVAAALIAPPGPEVIAELSRLDPAALSDGARVDLLVAWERQAAWVSAATTPVLASVGDAAQSAAAALQTGRDASELPLRSAHAEISAALRMSEMVAATRLETARSLTSELASVREALAAGDISYRHANAIAEATRAPFARDGVCAFPTCNRSAQLCELDHTQPYRPGLGAGRGGGGGTDRNNLGALCDRHHRLKHEAGWTLRRDPGTEVATWTSPAGRRHLVDHHDYRSLDPSDPFGRTAAAHPTRAHRRTR
jgi:hypothetical protein